jgi:hypothetical protein
MNLRGSFSTEKSGEADHLIDLFDCISHGGGEGAVQFGPQTICWNGNPQIDGVGGCLLECCGDKWAVNSRGEMGDGAAEDAEKINGKYLWMGLLWEEIGPNAVKQQRLWC